MQLFHQCSNKFSALCFQRLRPVVCGRHFDVAVYIIQQNHNPLDTALTKLYSSHQPVYNSSAVNCKASSSSKFKNPWVNSKPLLLTLNKAQTHITRSFACSATMAASPKKFLFPNTAASPSSRKGQNVPRPITVCVEGNIGSGKTTLLNRLAMRPDVEVLEEPVHKWRNIKGKNLLDLMYLDPVRWSHLFQTYVQLTMMQLHLKPSTANVKIMERSIHSAKHCFVENLYQTGRMSEPEYNVYCEWYSTITDNLDIPVDLIVYLSASPTLAQQRIRERGRAEEANIPLSYLSELHELHRDWLSSDSLPAPVLILPPDMTLDQMTKVLEERIDQLLGRPPPAIPQTCPPCAVTYPSHSPANSPTKLAASLLPASASN